MFNSEYLIIPWDWLESSLNGFELEKMYEFLERASFDKDEDRRIVAQEIPCHNEALNYMNRKKKVLTKDELLVKLAELSKLDDSEIAHIEAVEALLNYINDENIADAYLEVPLCF